MEPKDVVRRGYDALSNRYRGDREEPAFYAGWSRQLRERVPDAGAVLDVGCGCGVPLARELARSGYAVTGVDLSAVQVGRARRLAPAARSVHADATQVAFPAGVFDAVVCLYMLFHLPLAEQPVLLDRMATWLRPRGWLLVTAAEQAWTGTEDGRLGGPAPMTCGSPSTRRPSALSVGRRLRRGSALPGLVGDLHVGEQAPDGHLDLRTVARSDLDLPVPEEAEAGFPDAAAGRDPELQVTAQPDEGERGPGSGSA
jgi:SAM-dependent methyltransferase